MRLTNRSRYDDDEVRALVAFAMKGVKTERLAVIVKNTSHAYAGTAYDHTPSMSPTAKMRSVDRLVTIRVGSPDKFPSTNMVSKWEPSQISPGRYVLVPQHPYGGKRSPFMEYADWREAIVAVAAHEARHIYQYQHKKRRSEVDAERHAAKRLEAFRLTHSLQNGAT